MAEHDDTLPRRMPSLTDIASMLSNPKEQRLAARILAQAVTSGIVDVVPIDYALLGEVINKMLRSDNQRVVNSGVRAAIAAGMHNAALMRVIDQAQQAGLKFSTEDGSRVRTLRVVWEDQPAQSSHEVIDAEP